MKHTITNTSLSHTIRLFAGLFILCIFACTGGNGDELMKVKLDPDESAKTVVIDRQGKVEKLEVQIPMEGYRWVMTLMQPDGKKFSHTRGVIGEEPMILLVERLQPGPFILKFQVEPKEYTNPEDHSQFLLEFH